MASILELPEARERAMRWSVEDYEQYGEMFVGLGIFPKRAELIRGIIIEKILKSSFHVHLSKRIYDLMMRQVSAAKYTVFQEGPLRLTDSEPEPDISVVLGAESELVGANPATAALVVEIAVSSVAMDREYALLYAEAGVPEYWIILAEAGQIEVRCELKDGNYQTQRTFGSGETLVCQSIPGVSVVLDELFAKLPKVQ